MLASLIQELRKLGRRNLQPGSPAAYFVAAICLALASLAHFAFAQLVEDVSPSVLGYAAIFIATLVGGVRVGIVTAVLTMAIGWSSFDSPYFSDRISALSRAINYSLYAAVAAVIIILAARLRRADERHLELVRSESSQGGLEIGRKARLSSAAGNMFPKLQLIWREGFRPHSAAAYTFALTCVAAGTLLRICFGSFGDIVLPFAFFYPAVLVVSLIAGMEAALLAMILSLVIVGWAFYPPYYSFGPPTRGQIIDMGLYLFASLVALWFAERYRRVVPRLRADQASKLNFYAPIVVSFGVVLLATLLLVAIEPYIGPQYLIIGYLIPTAVVAVLYGSAFAFLTSFASALAAAYFLFPPLLGLYIGEPTHIVELAFFVIVALAVGQVSALVTFGVARDLTQSPPKDDSIFFEGKSSRARTGILLIHSLGGSPLELRNIAHGLAQRGFTVSCCQLAGHNGSEGDLLATGWTDWYGSAERALAGIETQCDVIVVGGLSVGSILALRLAELNPSRVHGLCLFAPTLRYDGWAIPWYSFLLMLGVRAPFLRRMRFADPPPYGIKDEATRAMIANTAGKPGETGTQFTSLGTLQNSHWLVRDVVKRLSSIVTPALIIHPREDDVSDLSNTIYLQRKLGGLVECLVLDDSYHLITIDRQRDLVLDRTADFIAFVERRTAGKHPDMARLRPSVIGGREHSSAPRVIPPPQDGST